MRMVGRRVVAAAALLALVVVVLSGCGGTDQLLHGGATRRPARTTSTTRTQAPSAESVYLARLGAEQTQLANAEQSIPTSPRTPAALAHSIDLLAGAIRRLGNGLAAIKPPAGVAVDHARLVTIMRSYAAKLDQAAKIAVSPGEEQRASALLISATDDASRSFTITTTAIDSTLGSSPS